MITKEFIKDLKKADNVSLRVENGKATIRTKINEKKNHKTGWIKPEVVNEHEVLAYLPANFTKAWFWDHYKNLYGFEALSLLLRVGDELTFRISENNNGYLDKAMIPLDAWENDKDRRYHTTYNNLYHEVITARIVRKNRVVVDRLYIADEISVNNSARILS